MVKVILNRNVLEANDRIAEANRRRLADLGVFAVNLIGSPGCGKTTLLEDSLRRLLSAGRRPAVIEGDLETSRDAERIDALKVPTVQINTRGGCHLEASLVREAMEALSLEQIDLLFIENVGNLVCPTAFDIGESAKAIVLSVTEGDDKPAKYASAFDVADVVVVSKLDLLPHTDFSLEAACRDLREVQPDVVIFPLSARTGEGVEPWQRWLEARGLG